MRGYTDNMDSQRKNKCIIINTIWKYHVISRIELSRLTGLNKATVTNIIKEFLDQGIVKETGEIAADNGRKVTGISLQMDQYMSIVLRIQRHHIRTALYNVNGKLSNIRRVRYRNSLDINDILQQFIEEIQHQLEFCKSNNYIVLGISVACLGWLYVKNEKYQMKVDGFRILGEVDIKDELKKVFPSHRIIMDHDANMSAVAEWYHYFDVEKRVPESMISIVGGIGFGGGIIIKGQVYHGYNGIAGEVGHMGINCTSLRKGMNVDSNYNGGIFEEYASPQALQSIVCESLYDFPDTSLNESSKSQDIYAAYENNDSLAVWAVNRMARYLAYGLTCLIFVLNPEVIVLGDEIIRSEKFNLHLDKYMREFLPEELYLDLNIRFSEYSEDGIMIGAGITLILELIEDEQLIDFIKQQIGEMG